MGRRTLWRDRRLNAYQLSNGYDMDDTALADAILPQSSAPIGVKVFISTRSELEPGLHIELCRERAAQPGGASAKSFVALLSTLTPSPSGGLAPPYFAGCRGGVHDPSRITGRACRLRRVGGQPLYTPTSEPEARLTPD